MIGSLAAESMILRGQPEATLVSVDDSGGYDTARPEVRSFQQG